jgi:recA bacterial DNA recombination protein
MSSPVLIRAQIEASLADRIPSAFALRSPVEIRTMPMSVSAIDSAIGGIPCSGITEIAGPSWCSAGRKSLQAQLLACATRDQFCALVDANDSFDPRSAKTVGVNLERVLWIRGGGRGVKAMEQAFKASDLLLQGSGGFGLIMVDLAGISERFVRRVPLTTWFRFRSVAEKLAAPLVFITSYPVLGTCASLTLTLSAGEVRWSLPMPGSPPHARLPTGLNFQVEVGTRRSFKKPSQPIRGFWAQQRWA